MGRKKRPAQKSSKPRASERGPGRPPKFRPEFMDITRRHFEHGATDVEVADILGISRSTFYAWQHEHPEFLEAVKLGKIPADDRVERSLYSRAVGYEYDSVKIMQDKGRPVIVPFREHVPPDPGSAFNWLKNRRPDQWRDKLDVDATLRPVDVTAEPLSPDEWDAKYGGGKTS